MQNKIIEEQKKKLLESLSPEQQKHLDSLDWLMNGPRGSGRTHLLCAVALLHVLNGGQGIVFDHNPSYFHKSSHLKNMILYLAHQIGLHIQIKEVSSGAFIISRVPEMIEYEIEYRKRNEKKS